MPDAVAVIFLPPKSAAAVPDIKECTPITAMVKRTAAVPKIEGLLRIEKVMMTKRTIMIALLIAAGGPRRDWKKRSETVPAKNPPKIPVKQSNRPQLFIKN
ncbi:hypothetical protein D3C87_1501290 [compost metagenome]